MLCLFLDGGGWLREQAAKSVAWAQSRSFSSRAFRGKIQFHTLHFACQGATRQRGRGKRGCLRPRSRGGWSREGTAAAGALLAAAAPEMLPERAAGLQRQLPGTRQTLSSGRTSREMLNGPEGPRWESCPGLPAPHRTRGRSGSHRPGWISLASQSPAPRWARF